MAGFGTQLAESIISAQFDQTQQSVQKVLSVTVERMQDDNVQHKAEIGKEMFKNIEESKGNQRMQEFYDALLKKLEKPA